MVCDIIRSIYGVFEVPERYRHMASTLVSELLTNSLLDAIVHLHQLQSYSLNLFRLFGDGRC